MAKTNIIGGIQTGGWGTRVRPLTNYFNKSMIPFEGKRPILWYILEFYKKNGIGKVVIDVFEGANGQQIKDYFGNGRRFGIEIEYTDGKLQGGNMSILRAFKDAKEPVFITFCDIIPDNRLEIGKIVQEMEASGSIVAATLKELQAVAGFGVALVEKGRIIKVQDKPIENKQTPISRLINCSQFVLTPEAIKIINTEKLEPFLATGKQDPGNQNDMFSNGFVYLMEQGRGVAGYVASEAYYWNDVGCLPRLLGSQLEMASRFEEGIFSIPDVEKQIFPNGAVAYKKGAVEIDPRAQFEGNSFLEDVIVGPKGKVINSVMSHTEIHGELDKSVVFPPVWGKEEKYSLIPAQRKIEGSLVMWAPEIKKDCSNQVVVYGPEGTIFRPLKSS